MPVERLRWNRSAMNGSADCSSGTGAVWACNLCTERGRRRMRTASTIPLQAGKIALAGAEIADTGNLSHIGRAIDEIMLAINVPKHMRNTMVSVRPEDSANRT